MTVLNDVLDIIHNSPQAAITPDVHAAASATSDEIELTQSCVQLIERDEGCVLHAYPDPGTGGEPWTIGYGHTGPDVYPGRFITQTTAEALLEQDLTKFEEGVNEAITGDCNDNQFSAMVSLAFNIGLGGFRASSVLRFHNAGDYAKAADAFLLWDKSGGRVLPGLIRRRRQERELYLGLAIDP